MYIPEEENSNFNTYLPISDPSIRERFLSYIKSLKFKEFNYVSIESHDLVTKCITSLMSSSEWQNQYKQNNYDKYDPIRSLILNTNRNIIFIDEIDFLDSLGAEVMMKRKLSGIVDGVILVQRYWECNYTLMLGSSTEKLNLRDFLIENYSEIQKIFNDLKEIINFTVIPNTENNSTISKYF